MTKFAPNLTMLFQETSFLNRFECSKKAGFEAVEYLFPYEFDARILRNQLDQWRLKQILFNAPAGNWHRGERGVAIFPKRSEEFREGIKEALNYALMLNNKKIHVMAGICNKSYSNHKKTFIENIRYAAKEFATFGINLMIEPINQRSIPGYFLSSQKQAAQLIDEIGEPNVRLLLPGIL